MVVAERPLETLVLTGTDSVTRDVEVHDSQQLIHVSPRQVPASCGGAPHIMTSNGTCPDRQQPTTFFQGLSGNGGVPVAGADGIEVAGRLLCRPDRHHPAPRRGTAFEGTVANVHGDQVILRVTAR
ncbi:hypothetical protein SY2F82_58130 [Streptomyces sp. Y2F8-2]|nr:hypothetical protein SY2F82_58130 [Streptomyces sp. Y2F8-2]